MEIKIQLPDSKAPGFLRRSRKALEFQQAITDNRLTAQKLDEFVSFVLEFVVMPVDKEEARNALWDASEDELLKVVVALGGETQTIPLET
jgi:hypothetical protein